jgi:dihydroorotase
MVHIGNAPPVLDDVLDLLRSGDIVTHSFHGKVGGIFTYGGKVLPALRAALDRGVLLDVGHGRSSFSFTACERALEQGVPVHSISTDIHRGNVGRYVVSLARTMTKLMVLGLDLVEVVRAVTSAPAGALGLAADGFGALAVGRPAHLTVFTLRADPLELEDSEGVTRVAPSWIEPVACFIGGRHRSVVAPL